jgi:hypothetical protein
VSAAKYPRRTIALGPPFDDGTVPGEERPADASERPPTIQRALAADQPSNARSSNKPFRQPTRGAVMSHRRRVVRCIPIEEGAEVDMGDSGLPGITGAHNLMGYQPAPLGPRTAAKNYQPHGWLVFLVNEEVTGAWPRRLRRLSKVG